MKVFVYINNEKVNNSEREKVFSSLKKFGVSYTEMTSDDFFIDKADAIIVVGGDGTILSRTTFSNNNNIPILGINAGRLGFLSEFELNEIDDAISLLIKGELVVEKRATIEVSVEDKKYLCLNDAVLQRIYTECCGQIISFGVYIDGNFIENITGDGVIISTPTGSTAYSLSAGGAILAPGINAFSVTPICAHSFRHRPVIYSSDSVCEIKYIGGTSAGLFSDGKLVGELKKGEIITVKKSDNPTTFLRKKQSNFFSRLSEKLKDRAEGR